MWADTASWFRQEGLYCTVYIINLNLFLKASYDMYLQYDNHATSQSVHSIGESFGAALGNIKIRTALYFYTSKIPQVIFLFS